jgi:hypothetical protein
MSYISFLSGHKLHPSQSWILVQLALQT